MTSHTILSAKLGTHKVPTVLNLPRLGIAKIASKSKGECVSVSVNPTHARSPFHPFYVVVNDWADESKIMKVLRNCTVPITEGTQHTHSMTSSIAQLFSCTYMTWQIFLRCKYKRCAICLRQWSIRSHVMIGELSVLTIYLISYSWR